MKDRKTAIESLRTELARCILLEEEEKKFWIDHASSLPSIVLENVCKIISDKNKIMDVFLMEALQNDPDHIYLSNLKAKILEIKKKAFEIEQASSEQTAEEILKKQLENL